MQTLETINVGQEPNDGTGDPHRTAFQKVNANFAKVVEGVNEAGTAAQSAAEAAEAAAREISEVADAVAQVAADSIPSAQKGGAGGVAPLDAERKVPAAHLPELDFIPSDQKGAVGGVAPLDAAGKVPPDFLPASEDAIPLTEKGAALGVAPLDGNALIPSVYLPPIPSATPVGLVEFWPLRASIPAGRIPLDGQIINRQTYPDLAAMVAAGTLPSETEALWQSDPLQRGKYSTGDAATTIRLPDYNGKSPGTLGALFLRGDGSLSAGSDGLIQRDAVQNIAGTMIFRNGPLVGGTGAFVATANTGPSPATGMVANGTLQNSDVSSFDASRVARTASETRPTNVTGVWVVNAFGAVTNPGSVDAAQLTSDLATLSAAFQTLNAAIDAIIIYPNGSEAAPATIIANSRYVFANPFPGYEVAVDVQIKNPEGLGTWFCPGWATTYVTSAWQSHGASVSQLGTGQLILQTGNTRVALSGSVGGGGAGEIASLSSALVRLRVRKMKGYQ